MLLACIIPFTQNHLFAQQWSIGPAVGLNFTTFAGDGITRNTYLPGFVAGGVINYSNIKDFGFSAKLLFSQYGSEYELGNLKTRLNYIQIPFYAVYYFGDLEDYFRPKIFVGPYVSFLMSANDTNGNDLDPNDTVFNSVDGGALAGVGFNYRMVRGVWLNLDLQYSLGLADLNKTNVSSAYYNRGFGAMLGVAFSLTPEE